MNKKYIIKSNDEFQRIIKNCNSYKYKDYILYIEKNNQDSYHFGFSVGKKIGKAVIRNKIKRQLKSIVSKKSYQNGFNCIIIVGKNILNRTFLEMQEDLLKILNNQNLIKGEK